jgi:cyclic-di-AMP phosphodiesterase PgpH
MPIDFRRNSLKIYVFLLFLFVYAIVVLLFPKERKFEYEFTKGAPWMHKDLIAEYDFPVYKTQNALDTEIDSIRQSFVPYFRKDTSMLLSVEAVLNVKFKENWQLFLDRNEGFDDIAKLRQEPKLIGNYLQGLYLLTLREIYENGLIRIPDSLEIRSVQIQEGEMSYLRQMDDLINISDVDSVFREKLKLKLVENHKENRIIQDFISQFRVSSYLQPNLVYNKETNDLILDEAIASISLTKGLVQKGELVIQQGAIVDEHAFELLNSLKYEHENNMGITNKGFLILGISLLYLAAAFSLFMFLWNFKPKILQSVPKISFILLQVLLFTGLSFFIMRSGEISIYVLPFVIVPMMVQSFFDDRTALFVHIIVVLMVGFVAPNGFEFVFIQIIAGIVAVYSLTNIQQRKRLFVTSFYVLVSYALLYFSMQILYGGGIDFIDYQGFIWFAISAGFILFTIPLIWVYEKLFGFVSDVTLIELTDTNHPLLRQLAEKAPGTFQHSLQVGNLAEAVCREIGGNPLLVRTGALYHDIGKAASPEFFVENQSGINPHDKMDFDQSAQKIISHVNIGVEMAKKAKLPESVVDFIRTHHGVGKTQFFYRSYINNNPGKSVDEKQFTYPGPTPRNIENAILMMADSIEAAARSMEIYDAESISKLVNNIIDAQLKEGQFDNVDITLRKISQAKQVFVKKLMSIYHARIAYPELNKNLEDSSKTQ